MNHKKEHPKVKPGLHPRNQHNERYDFRALAKTCPELAPFVAMNPYGDESVDFFNPEAVKMLNKALLKHFYDIGYWDIPNGYLCPPIPGRADYIHHMADLPGAGNRRTGLAESRINCLDIGTGANCIYPILGNRLYDWSFVGSEIDHVAMENAETIILKNPCLTGQIEIRLQKNVNDIFKNVIRKDEYFDLTFCNPPFHSSPEDAGSGSRRKISNLKGKKTDNPILNFGGTGNELWCEGGEEQFVKQMIAESRQFSAQCGWFSALISKSLHLPGIYHALKIAEATEIKTIEMSHGNKVSRIVAWKFVP
ncbi:MAG: 23S rRNA (adenine(1618)-N(6))-methyltransferase RlmF [Prolixibacteraceae bacterium]